ncbi:MAG: alpha-amylase family glycosyl hydrolase, partial [Clostridia bacterium]|nr:alpha-amylase family glycosyl hydrolase [Clostridia bacterium]
GQSFFYGIFSDAMPDLNYDNPDVRKEIENVAQFWMKMGVRGFRLDAALHIYGDGEAYRAGDKNVSNMNVSWWKEFAKACEVVNPDAYLIGEVWEKPEVMAPYYAAFDSTFNFSIGTDVISMLNSGANIEENGGFAEKLDSIYKTYKTVDQNMIDAPFLSNHDQNRVMSSVNNDVTKAKLAASIYLTLPGNPFIYYGEEIGMVGTKPDEIIREPFIWSKSDDKRTTKWEKITANKDTVPYDVQAKDSNSLFSHYKEIIALRKATPALMTGDFAPIKTDNTAVIGYSRFIQGQGGSCYVFHNVSGASQTITLADTDASSSKVLYKSDQASAAKGNTITLAPMSTLILKNP